MWREDDGSDALQMEGAENGVTEEGKGERKNRVQVRKGTDRKRTVLHEGMKNHNGSPGRRR